LGGGAKKILSEKFFSAIVYHHTGAFLIFF
jgi:hypothetical protein